MVFEIIMQRWFVMVPDVAIERLDFQLLDSAKVDDLLTGCKITGAEPVDYPVTDGFLLYLIDKTGRRFVLSIYRADDDYQEYTVMSRAPYQGTDKERGA